MSPPTGPRKGSGAPTTRVTRSASGPTRGGAPRGGGGIRKRPGGGPARVDRDGDLSMDGPSGAKGEPRKHASGSASSRGRGSASRPSRQKAMATAEQKIRRHLGGTDADLSSRISELPRKKTFASRKTFKITGLRNSKAANNPDRGEKTAVEFIERKSSSPGQSPGVKVIKSRLDSDFNLFITIHQDDADKLMRLNNFMFAGSALSIEESTERWPDTKKPQLSQESAEHKSQLQQVLSARYNGETKLLNLSSLGQDPVLIGMGYLEDKERAEKTFRVLMAICDDTFSTPEAKRDGVQSVSLANNSIDWVGQIFDLATTFPDLKHLDLSGNSFKTVKSLVRWRGRFKGLETLLLAGSPLESEDPEFKDIIQWFPKLLNLSGAQVRTPEQVAAEAAKATQHPIPIPQQGTDFRDIGGVAEAFLTQFMPLYDTDRAQLVKLFYDESSQFSLSVTTHTPNPDSPVLPWATYIKYSRNLTRISTISARVQRLMKGGGTIAALWAQLPRTKHPDLKTEIHKYIVDCHPLPGLEDPTGQSSRGVDGLIITMQGEFEEVDPPSGKTGLRSFTRTFVLGPGRQPGTVRVISDMFSLRAHNHLPDQSPASSPSEEQKQQLTMELSKQTNMTPQYSRMCLEEVGWSFENAMAKFIQIKANLGPEVFVGGT